jgi:ATP-binding cassette subfamily C protein CydC
LAGISTQLLALVALWVLVAPAVAIWVVGGYVLGAAVTFGWMARTTVPLSRRAEVAAQAFRTRLIDLIRARRDLAVYGRLVAQRDAVLNADDRRRNLRRLLDRAERRAGAALGVIGTGVAAGALGIGLMLAQAGQVQPAFAALGFFAALALAETLAPLRRAVSDLGRMADAARRVRRDLAEPASAKPSVVNPHAETVLAVAEPIDLRVADLTLVRAGTNTPVVVGLSFVVGQGETVAITGASGAGKSTLLLAIAGLYPVIAGHISLGGRAVTDWSEADLRGLLTLLPQRSALMIGTVAEALHLANPADNVRLWQVLEAVQLDQVIRNKGGLSARIGPRGEGLSGGEARRLTLARTLLRNPDVLLLDEPTEGLDEATALAVLQGVRRLLPEAAILIAAHRQVETDFADRVLKLN